MPVNMSRRLLGEDNFEPVRSNSVPDLAHLPFDPNEPVPSYESSQLMHRTSANTPNLSRHASVLDTASIIRRGSLEQEQGRSLFASFTNPLSVGGPMAASAAGSGSSAATGAVSASVPGSGTNTGGSGSSGNSGRDSKKSLKRLGLKFLNARQHFALACCRDLSLIPCLYGLIQAWKRVFLQEDTNFVEINGILYESFTGARISEHFLTGVWCIVSAYLSYSVLDGLMVRWIVTYLTSAAIVRMLSMSMIIVSVEQYLVATFSAQGYKYGLHIWILISCCLTIVFVVQNFVTLNLDLKDGKKRARFFDFYNIAVFAVVPIGLASFVTMIGLLRSLLILRLDLEVSRDI